MCVGEGGGGQDLCEAGSFESTRPGLTGLQRGCHPYVIHP